MGFLGFILACGRFVRVLVACYAMQALVNRPTASQTMNGALELNLWSCETVAYSLGDVCSPLHCQSFWSPKRTAPDISGGRFCPAPCSVRFIHHSTAAELHSHSTTLHPQDALSQCVTMDAKSIHLPCDDGLRRLPNPPCLPSRQLASVQLHQKRTKRDGLEAMFL